MKVYLVTPAPENWSFGPSFHNLKATERAETIEDAQEKAREMAKEFRGTQIWILEAEVKQAFYAEPERIPVSEVEPQILPAVDLRE
ncbi:hypothetical protein [Ochrobactrum chromiisoli]|uniref:DUF2188 domain-containing protein n=1 Tax=Ochrobactrum chromiisoli TaxID=2993941 RepID=A0ABT3QM81_9HYPH|nr:hypothetical protein [Ochrobactrum chromiisoli]MCX2696724.1 hypothetical protein [Ochrobactrum chromiisoli]